LAGLLVAGLGTLYVVSGRLESSEFAFASLIDRPFVPVIMAILWWRGIIPGSLALAFSVADFGGFLWTLSAWRAATRATPAAACPPFRARAAARIFGFLSGVGCQLPIFPPPRGAFPARGPSRPPPNPGPP